jgi:hypothetical protein
VTPLLPSSGHPVLKDYTNLKKKLNKIYKIKTRRCKEQNTQDKTRRQNAETDKTNQNNQQVISTTKKLSFRSNRASSEYVERR